MLRSIGIGENRAPARRSVRARVNTRHRGSTAPGFGTGAATGVARAGCAGSPCRRRGGVAGVGLRRSSVVVLALLSQPAARLGTNAWSLFDILAKKGETVSVSLEDWRDSLLVLGATTQEVGRVIARSSAAPAA